MAAYRIAFLTKWFFSPYLLINLFVCKNSSLIIHQQVEKVILLCCQMYLLSVSIDFSLVWIDFKSGERNYHFIIQMNFFKIGIAF